jgi:hypothetical protein
MNGALLTEADLVFLASALAPGSDRGRMVRVLREDAEILDGMLADDRLLCRIMDRPEAPLAVSPRLFFAVLLNQARRDLASAGYTVEQSNTVVFDAPRVAGLLEDRPIRDYLVELLAGFVRVHSATVTVRVRKGVWHRLRFNDLDLIGLIRYTSTLEESLRFPWYRRIADLCLFLVGVFPEHAVGDGPRAARASAAGTVPVQGRSFYRAAARHPVAARDGSAPVLLLLAEQFDLAAKPLAHVTSRYLGPLRDRLFDT